MNKKTPKWSNFLCKCSQKITLKFSKKLSWFFMLQCYSEKIVRLNFVKVYSTISSIGCAFIEKTLLLKICRSCLRLKLCFWTVLYVQTTQTERVYVQTFVRPKIFVRYSFMSRLNASFINIICIQRCYIIIFILVWWLWWNTPAVDTF